MPLRDTVRSSRRPVITIGLIAVNSLVFIYELSLGQHINQFVTYYGMIPHRLLSGDYAGQFEYGGRYLSVFTAMFLHGGWLHLIGNMLYLWIFGDNVEDRLGRPRFLVFYILCGVAASIGQAFASPHSNVPTIGASGAIAGVLGAYFTLFPKARVLTLVPIGFIIRVMELPAFFFLGFWFLIQFLYGSMMRGDGGVAWWAHVGGFAAGAVLVQIFKKR